MSEFTISTAHNDTRLAATAAFADTGVNASKIDFFDATDTLLVSVPLAKPCGVVTNNALVLTAADPLGVLILVDGIATRATWTSGSGQLVAEGAVSDETGEGPFFLGGADGTQLYAGGRAVLGLTEIT